MWPFRPNRPDGDDDEWVSKAIPITTLARWYMYDVDVKDANKLAVALDLTPVSEEGDEKERQDSDVRIRRVEGVMEFINTMAEINAKAVLQVQMAELPPELQAFLKSGPAELEQLLKFYESMSFAAILTSFSSAAELGIIDLSGRFTSKEIGDDYE